MASNLRVDNIQPSIGMGIGIGTANGTVTFNGDVTDGMTINGGLRVYANTNIATFKNNQLRSDAAGAYYFDHGTTGQSFTFRTSTSSSLDTTGPSVTSTGNISFPSGKGIDFSATGDASGMSSEVLDDYEEGSWTPHLYVGSTQQSLDVSYGVYRKIGSLLFIKCHVSCNGAPSGTGAVQIRNLPIAQASGGLSQTALSVQWSGTLNRHGVYANTWTTGNVIQLNYSTASGNTGNLQHSDIAANSNFGIAGCYEV